MVKHFAGLYTRKTLFQLFMVCTFPIHVWAIIMAFRDFSWVAERTTTWDAIGLFSYAVVFALVESLGMFLVVCSVGVFTPGWWGAEKRASLLGFLYLMLGLWAILGQLFSLNGYPVPHWVVALMVYTGRPFLTLWGGVFLLVAASTAIPVFFLARLDGVQKGAVEFFDRISMLSSLYLFLDAVGVVVIVIRNVSVY